MALVPDDHAETDRLQLRSRLLIGGRHYLIISPTGVPFSYHGSARYGRNSTGTLDGKLNRLRSRNVIWAFGRSRSLGGGRYKRGWMYMGIELATSNGCLPNASSKSDGGSRYTIRARLWATGAPAWTFCASAGLATAWLPPFSGTASACTCWWGTAASPPSLWTGAALLASRPENKSPSNAPKAAPSAKLFPNSLNIPSPSGSWLTAFEITWPGSAATDHSRPLRKAVKPTLANLLDRPEMA